MTDIFVFGSDLQGRHGKGAALYAMQHHGAIRGVGEGRQGNSYAIPTKRTPWTALPLDEIAVRVDTFKMYAAKHPDDRFNLTPIGCGHAGYYPWQIAPLFEWSPSNVIMPDWFLPFLQLSTIATADIVARDDGTQGPSIEHEMWVRV